MRQELNTWITAIKAGLLLPLLFSAPIAYGVVNGKLPSGSEFFLPFVVGIGTASNDEPKIYCTGVLIAPNTALTAAHCLWFGPQEQGYVLFGPKDSEAATRKIIHSKMSKVWFLDLAEFSGDVAIVQFEGELPKGFQPAPIYPQHLPLLKNDKVTIVGFGAINRDVKRENLKGAGILRYATGRMAEPPPQGDKVSVTMNRSVSSNGDSGGPGFIFKNGKYFILGTLRSSSCDERKNCSVHFARTAPYQPLLLKWVQYWDDFPRLAEKEYRACLVDNHSDANCGKKSGSYKICVSSGNPPESCALLTKDFNLCLAHGIDRKTCGLHQSDLKLCLELKNSPEECEENIRSSTTPALEQPEAF